MGASRATPISRVNVLVATIFGLVVLGESANLGHLLGVILLVVGVVTVSYEIESRKSKSQTSGELSLGLIFPLAAMVLLGLESPISKIGLNEGVPVIVGLSVKFLVALVTIAGFFLLPVGLLLHRSRRRKNIFILGLQLQTHLGWVFFIRPSTYPEWWSCYRLRL
ncbi:hypothetical protein AKJ57_04300 [candidate division MSBL1 archaeon SCGC-AAA259A05]|uniref:Uncharacterized protein n=1 Tax=candidate division MSBL1 archaeon SCGC-AAA259A05 TaxID=1698259 RepID=A0A133U7S6_9EURY|nr:hypothetical protein AKJ57_04300 [candidate division MSBL1 archaeon SCGC-AAA259A05]